MSGLPNRTWSIPSLPLWGDGVPSRGGHARPTHLFPAIDAVADLAHELHYPPYGCLGRLGLDDGSYMCGAAAEVCRLSHRPFQRRVGQRLRVPDEPSPQGMVRAEAIHGNLDLPMLAHHHGLSGSHLEAVRLHS